MKLKTLTAALALAALLPAHAALTSNPGDITGTVVDFEAFDGLITTGPEMVSPGLIFTGDSGSVLGANIADLGQNGLWGAGNMFALGCLVQMLRY